MKYFLTFGQKHVHSVDGKTFDKASVAVIHAPDMKSARETAFDTFGGKWAFMYTQEDVDKRKNFWEFFPRGPIEVNKALV